MILSILICTIPKRRDLFNKLTFELRSQILRCGAEVEILADNGTGTIGGKRQRLLEKASGDYVVFIDDDDWVAEDYVSSIVKSAEYNTDVIGFLGWITTNGQQKKTFMISRLCEYRTTPKRYERFNNHLSPVKREIALQIGYKDISWEEDYDYAVRLHKSGLVKTENFIHKYLYFYRYATRKTYT